MSAKADNIAIYVYMYSTIKTMRRAIKRREKQIAEQDYDFGDNESGGEYGKCLSYINNGFIVSEVFLSRESIAKPGMANIITHELVHVVDYMIEKMIGMRKCRIRLRGTRRLECISELRAYSLSRLIEAVNMWYDNDCDVDKMPNTTVAIWDTSVHAGAEATT